MVLNVIQNKFIELMQCHHQTEWINLICILALLYLFVLLLVICLIMFKLYKLG